MLRVVRRPYSHILCTAKHCSTHGFTITEDIFPDLDAFVCEVVPLAQKWLDATADRGDTLEEYLDDVENQCREIAEQDAGKGGYEKMGGEQLKTVSIAIVNVETLVQFGRIPNDEYNGIVWLAEGGMFRTPKLVS